MNISTVSAKYQVVIPKKLRAKLQIKPGQKVYLSSNKRGEIIVKTTSVVSEMYGSMKGAWGHDPDKELKKMRDEWEDRQKELDKLWTKN
jgi:AbrB family looped-hinge helix DNA binding protein